MQRSNSDTVTSPTESEKLAWFVKNEAKNPANEMERISEGLETDSSGSSSGPQNFEPTSSSSDKSDKSDSSNEEMKQTFNATLASRNSINNYHTGDAAKKGLDRI